MSAPIEIEKESDIQTQHRALEQSPPQGRSALSNLQSLISLAHVNVALNGHRVLHDISWELRCSENWALFGHNGAGKSTLLRLLRGEIWPAPIDGGARIYNFAGKPTESPIGIQQRMAVVSAEQQQRYQRVHGRKYGDDFRRASPCVTLCSPASSAASW